MNLTAQALLLTGRPGTGKTTLVKNVLERTTTSAEGFYTEEVRQRGVRIGFDLVTLDGERAPLARVGLGTSHRVGKYGVDLESLNRVGVAALLRSVEHAGPLVVDEIGKMELLSPEFRDAVWKALERGKRIFGTILLQPHSWADRLKKDPRVAILMVTQENRSQVEEQVNKWLMVSTAHRGNEAE